MLQRNMPIEEASELIKAIPSSNSIRGYLHTYASVPHLGGSDNDFLQAQWTRDKFIEYGIENAVIETYYPVLNEPLVRRLAIVSGSDELLYEASLKEKPLPGEDERDDAVPTFHAYSGSGNVTAPVVYVNYGQKSDFEFLLSQGIPVQGTIALMRAGVVSHGLKVRLAETYQCVGALIYTDPLDDGPINKFKDDDLPDASYPKGPWRSASSVERSTVQFTPFLMGDVTTPGYGAISQNTTRRSVNESSPVVPTIPSLPISWQDAYPLLKATESLGVQPEQGWAGGLDNVSYFSGPSEALINLVNINNYQIKPIWNVIGRIEGIEEPDQVVILGNHRDAWGYGATHSSSGSAVMMELVRTLGVLSKRGWHPRRTIVIASWDAKEYGSVGATEWAENHQSWLDEQAIAYLNVDMAVSGSHFSAQASPLLHRLLYEVTRSVIDPRTSQSVYDSWQKRCPAVDGSAFPVIDLLHDPSDTVPFFYHLGVPSMSLHFKGSYGVRGSNYDNIYWMETFGDPTFEYHQTMVRLWGLVALHLANDIVLPMYPLDYANALTRYVDSISDQEQGYLSFPSLTSSIHALRRTCVRLDKKMMSWKKDVHIKKHHGQKLMKQILRTNGHIAQLERIFLDPVGLPQRQWYKHVLYAPDVWTGTTAKILPLITETLEEDGSPNLIREAEQRTASLIIEARELLRGRFDDTMDDDFDMDE
ncbi:uncharacterized protein BYT42DRAFT_244010 [Radiomyces spectabilis]|uniref:uncharacterized protein n=1 Tax=Radiomyces spectabilis TaxID=64574 RepID=UPI0022211A33|nr:uncharacterized protein BYT42DRAFT_244010 [Radiomyces spectabilis]KAI8388701.1 hypothetical protein BYT42DRAFT_244010 [Radiomyces spectabilis]